MSETAYIEKLSPVLFWDMDKNKLDAEAHSAGLVQRVLEYGSLEDWRLTRDFYGLDRVVDICKTLRTLDPMALSFISAITDTPKTEFRCYHFAQSNPTLWNS